MRGGFAAVVAAISAAAGFAVPAGASAAPAHGALVISGTKSARGWVTLPRKVRLSPTVLNPFEPGARIEMSGPVGGVLVWSRRELVFAEIKDAELDQPLVFGGFTKPTAGARYKVLLIADGATQVTLPLVGTRRDIGLRPSTPLDLTRRATGFPLPVSPITYESVPVDVRAGSLTIVGGGGSATGPPIVLGVSDMCIETKNLPCETQGVAGNSGTGLESQSASICIGSVTCQLDGAGGIFDTGLPVGRYFAALDAEDGALQQDTGLVALVLTPVNPHSQPPSGSPGNAG